MLNPGDEIKIQCQLCGPVNNIPIITLIWDDESKSNRKKEQAIDLN